MRFETSQSTPPHLNRRLQLRMLSFVGMIGLVMFFFSTLQSENVDKDGATKRRNATLDKSVFDVQEESPRSLKPDEFISPPIDDKFEKPVERSQEWLDEHAARGEEWAEDTKARDRESARRHTRFNKRLLANVKDNTLGIRRDESRGYFQLLNHAAHALPAELEQAAVPEVQYINLMTEPDRFRGEPITIQGDLWRLYEFEADSNEFGLTTLYEAWVFTGDSGNHPYRIVCTSLPHTLKPGENLRKPVRVTGYFFKREGYQSQGGMHVAPTLLAPTIIPFRPSSAIPPTDDLVPYMVGVVTAVGLSLLVTLLAFAIGDRRTKQAARQRALNEPRPSFAGLDAAPIVSVEESLRQLAEQERQAILRQQIEDSGRDAGSVATSVLYTRDPHATVPPRVPKPPSPERDFLARPAAQIGTLNTWTARQHAADEDSNKSRPDSAQHEREQHEVDRVLDELAPDASKEMDSSTFTLKNSHSNPSTEESRSPGINQPNGTSKLEEWEREIQQASSSQVSTPSPNVAANQKAAEEQLELDRQQREQELRDRLTQQRIKLESERQAQLEREQEAKVQSEWEASREKADQEREVIQRGHVTYDRAERHSSEVDADDSVNADEEDGIEDDEDSGNGPKGSSQSSGWARHNEQRAQRRRRGRHRRDDR